MPTNCQEKEEPGGEGNEEAGVLEDNEALVSLCAMGEGRDEGKLEVTRKQRRTGVRAEATQEWKG